jgi:hypothetical protein
MSRKWIVTLIMFGIFFLGFGFLVWAVPPIPVEAQCGNNPTSDPYRYTCLCRRRYSKPSGNPIIALLEPAMYFS